jgi:transposase
MKAEDFFLNPKSIPQKQYEALRAYYVENKPAKEVAKEFGYKHRGFTSIVLDFNKKLNDNKGENLFFTNVQKGRKPTSKINKARDIIISLRKQYLSLEEIKVALDALKLTISEKTIFNILKSEGFARLPRRQKNIRQQSQPKKLRAIKTVMCDFKSENFKTGSGGTLCLLPILKKYGIDKIIANSSYPETSSINRLSSILSFLALKVNNVRRYSADDLWCMDRGEGMFAGLNVLPKAAWFTSYSHRVTSDMNLLLLKGLHKVWQENSLLGDTSNLDFTTIPYWGDGKHLENNWSGKRNKVLSSMLAVLAHDPDTGIIDYGNANVRHENESNTVLEFLDFYRKGSSRPEQIKYIVFDSKFTNYQNLNKLNKDNVCFLTIRRRGANMVQKINNIPASQKKSIRVHCSGNKKRTIKVNDHLTTLKGYDGEIREIYITGNGKIKPAIIITNDFDSKVEDIVVKYARRWLVEKSISEQISFFHLNNVSSSMVIKVDFDLTMSILAFNLYRLFALETERYKNSTSTKLYESILLNSADIIINEKEIIVALKKKRMLPLCLEIMGKYKNENYGWLGNKKLIFTGATYS